MQRHHPPCGEQHTAPLGRTAAGKGRCSGRGRTPWEASRQLLEGKEPTERKAAESLPPEPPAMDDCPRGQRWGPGSPGLTLPSPVTPSPPGPAGRGRKPMVPPQPMHQLSTQGVSSIRPSRRPSAGGTRSLPGKGLQKDWARAWTPGRCGPRALEPWRKHPGAEDKGCQETNSCVLKPFLQAFRLEPFKTDEHPEPPHPADTVRVRPLRDAPTRWTQVPAA